MTRFTTRKAILDCPEGLGSAVQSGTFRIFELSSGTLRILQSERCDLEENGSACRRSCKLGTLHSFLHRYER